MYRKLAAVFKGCSSMEPVGSKRGDKRAARRALGFCEKALRYRLNWA